MSDTRYSASINFLFDFVHAVHTFGVMNPGTGTIQRFATPKAISEINNILKADKHNSVRALVRAKKPVVKRPQRLVAAKPVIRVRGKTIKSVQKAMRKFP